MGIPALRDLEQMSQASAISPVKPRLGIPTVLGMLGHKMGARDCVYLVPHHIHNTRINRKYKIKGSERN